MTGDNRILHAFALRLRHMAVPLPAPVAGDDDVSLRIIAITKELGEYLQAVAVAVTDGQVTGTEMRAIEREEGDLLRAVSELHSCLVTMRSRILTKGAV